MSLRRKGLSESSAETYGRVAVKFINWLAAQGVRAEKSSYRIILEYLECCRQKGWSQSTLRLHLEGIKKYLDYVGLDPNPALVQLRPSLRRIPRGLLKEEDLQRLYRGYPEEDVGNKIVLGLICFQALRRKELCHLYRQAIDLEKGKIQIESSRRVNGRQLNLASPQMLLLQNYLASHSSEKLFVASRMDYRMNSIMNQLKEMDPGLKNLRQLRASAITNWLRHSNLRQVQYMAGHRYVSSTERYQMNHLEDLQRELDKFHPMK